MPGYFIHHVLIGNNPRNVKIWQEIKVNRQQFFQSHKFKAKIGLADALNTIMHITKMLQSVRIITEAGKSNIRNINTL